MSTQLAVQNSLSKLTFQIHVGNKSSPFKMILMSVSYVPEYIVSLILRGMFKNKNIPPFFSISPWFHEYFGHQK